MELQLKNFRCWEDQKLSFPSSGCILLNGISGKGKSTCLNSILWAITGKLRKVSTFGKKSTRVQLVFETITIIRSACPNLLEVIYENVSYNGNEAQQIIDKNFGKYFDTISYIAQDSSESFVFKSPSEKFEFLEEILLKEHGVGEITIRIKNDICKTKEFITSEQARISTFKEILGNSKSVKMIELNIAGVRINSGNFGSTLLKIKNNIETSQKNLLTSENNFRKVEKNISIKKNLDKFLEEKNELSKKLSKESLDGLERKKNEYKKNKEYFILCKKHIEVVDKYEHLKKKKEEFCDEEETLEMIEKLLKEKTEQSFLYKYLYELNLLLLSDEEIDALEKDIEIIEKSIDSFSKQIKEYEDSKKTYSCPSCNSSLLMEKNKLVKFYLNLNTNEDEIEKIKKMLEENKKKRDIFLKKKEVQTKNFERYESTYNKLESIVSSEKWEMIEEELCSLKQKQKILQDPALKTLEYEKKAIEKKLEENKDSFQCEEISEEEFLKIVEEIGLIKEVTSRLLKISKEEEVLEKQFDSVLDEKKILLEEISEKIEVHKKKIETYKKNIEDLFEWEKTFIEFEKIEKLKEDIACSEKKLDGFVDRLKALTKLKDIVKESEQKCIEEFVLSLNFHAKLYIEEMFPDEDISVLLKTTKKEKVSLNFEVNYKQMIECDLSILSGGERDRVNLAYTLAFSELIQNKILMLDECISSLDEVNSSNVLRTLTENYKGLIICVCHQTVQGTFTQKIDL